MVREVTEHLTRAAIQGLETYMAAQTSRTMVQTVVEAEMAETAETAVVEVPAQAETPLAYSTAVLRSLARQAIISRSAQAAHRDTHCALDGPRVEAR